MKPQCNFFIAGGQRCGTTWLYNQLERHKEICMAQPCRPEPKFFMQPLPASESHYYRAHFPHYKGEKWAGEKSTSYCESNRAPKNISKLFPRAKIIFTLRDPVDRALSNYFFSVKHGLETRSPEDTFLTSKPPPDCGRNLSTDPFDYIGRGNYPLFLKNYMRIFGKDKILILLFEKLISDPTELNGVVKFLEIEPFPTDSVRLDKVNEAARTTLIGTDIIEAIRMKTQEYTTELATLAPQLDLSLWTGMKPQKRTVIR